MRLLRSLLFAAIFYPGTLIYVIGCFLALPLGPARVRGVVHAWTDFHGWLCRRLLGIHSRVDGVIPAGPHLIAVKHQAMYETIEMVRLIRGPVVVMKRQLSDLPLFGWATHQYGVIPVDREAGASALREMLVAGKAALKAGRPVLIFPEGTRVPPGRTPPLRSGFAGLYRSLGMPVVPIAMDSGRLWSQGIVKRPGVVTFKVGETIPAGLKRKDIEAAVHSAINALESAPQPRA